MLLTCPAPRRSQKQPAERHQHLMSTFSKHTKHCHPRSCCVYNMRGAINAFQQRLVPTLCAAYLTDKRISLPITQCAKRPGVFFRCLTGNNVEKNSLDKVQSILRDSQGISLTEVDCATTRQQNIDFWLVRERALRIWHNNEMLLISVW